MKVIILNITPYKEKDAIINALSEQEIVTFTAKSIFSEKSQNKILNIPLTIVDVELEKGKLKYSILKSYSDVDSPLISDTSLEYVTALNIIRESMQKLVADEDKNLLYGDLINALNALKNSNNYFVIVLALLNRIFKVGGYGFEVNRCVHCGTTKGIAAFSFQDGGFLCKDCVEKDTRCDLSPKEMLLLRSIYNAKDFDILNELDFDSKDVEHLLNLYFAYVFDNFGVALNSFKTF